MKIFKEQKFHEQKLMMNVDGVDLPIAITSPVNDSPIALILLIPGSLFNDVDGNYPEIMKITPICMLILPDTCLREGIQYCVMPNMGQAQAVLLLIII